MAKPTIQQIEAARYLDYNRHVYPWRKRVVDFFHSHRKAFVTAIGTSLTAWAALDNAPTWVVIGAIAFTAFTTGATPNAEPGAHLE